MVDVFTLVNTRQLVFLNLAGGHSTVSIVDDRVRDLSNVRGS